MKSKGKICRYTFSIIIVLSLLFHGWILANPPGPMFGLMHVNGFVSCISALLFVVGISMTSYKRWNHWSFYIVLSFVGLIYISSLRCIGFSPVGASIEEWWLGSFMSRYSLTDFDDSTAVYCYEKTESFIDILQPPHGVRAKYFLGVWPSVIQIEDMANIPKCSKNKWGQAELPPMKRIYDPIQNA